jgi:hypothetical protein
MVTGLLEVAQVTLMPQDSALMLRLLGLELLPQLPTLGLELVDHLRVRSILAPAGIQSLVFGYLLSMLGAQSLIGKRRRVQLASHGVILSLQLVIRQHDLAILLGGRDRGRGRGGGAGGSDARLQLPQSVPQFCILLA